MSERLTHSKFAAASTILPIAVWIYLLLVIGVFFVMNKLDISFFKGYEGAWALAALYYFFLFIVIPIGGHLAGLICGIIGLFSKTKKRVFAVLGLFLSVLPFAAGLIIYATGYKFENWRF